jgi:2-polyprenyl-6-methoxyphenol hydroxylase-like FAD-dependent oxidoreductase
MLRSRHGSATIVGAGIAGLATATALHAAGWEVQVLERGPRLSTAGSQLGVWPRAWRTLQTLGVADRLATGGSEAQRPVSSGLILRPDGTVLAEISTRRSSAPAPDRDLHLVPRLVPRLDLLEALLAGLPEGTVRWSAPIGPDAPAPPADVVVGADGINSAVRRAAFPGSRTTDTGLVAFRGVVPVPTDRAAETWGRQLLFGTTPFPGGGTNWYACLPLELAGSQAKDPLEVLGQVFRHWHPEIHRVLDAVPAGGADRRRLKVTAPLASYVSANTALVGDAAHAMLPHLGRGGGEALVDGLVLAESLAAAPSIGAGLARYDRERRRPTQRVVRASALMARLGNRTEHTGLRDALVAAAGQAASLRP